MKRKRHLLKQIFLNVMKDRFDKTLPSFPLMQKRARVSRRCEMGCCADPSSVLSDANKHEQGLAKGDVKELHGRHPVLKKTGKHGQRRLDRELLNAGAVMKATRKATWIHATHRTSFH